MLRLRTDVDADRDAFFELEAEGDVMKMFVTIRGRSRREDRRIAILGMSLVGWMMPLALTDECADLLVAAGFSIVDTEDGIHHIETLLPQKGLTAPGSEVSG